MGNATGAAQNTNPSALQSLLSGAQAMQDSARGHFAIEDK